MIGFPYYSRYNPNEGTPFDFVMDKKYIKHFVAGFTAAVVTSSTFSFAEEVKKKGSKVTKELSPIIAGDQANRARNVRAA